MFKNFQYLLTTHSLSQMPNDDLKEIVIVGKSNVGKSTFINVLANNKKLAYTSKNPGKTKALSFFLVDNMFRIVDVPGYGYARISKQQQIIFSKMIDSYLINRKNIKIIIILIDIRRSLQKEDREIISFLKHYNLKFLIIGTKKDLANQSELFKFQNNCKLEYGISPIIFSSKTKYNLDKIIEELKKQAK